MVMATSIDLSPVGMDITVLDGDDFVQPFAFQDSSGSAIDVTAWAFVARIDPGDGATIPLTVAHGGLGEITVSASAAALAGAVVGGAHFWELQRTDTVRTLFAGKWKVKEDKAVA